MKLADALTGVSRLGIDTAPIIYLVEANPRHEAIALAVFREIDAGRISGVTSVISLGEVLVLPLRQRDRALHERYRSVLLSSRGFRTVSIDAKVAERAADLRATYGMRLPDALQIACSIHEGCQAFLTNDRRLVRVSEIRVLMLDDLEP